MQFGLEIPRRVPLFKLDILPFEGMLPQENGLCVARMSSSTSDDTNVSSTIQPLYLEESHDLDGLQKFWWSVRLKEKHKSIRHYLCARLNLVQVDLSDVVELGVIRLSRERVSISQAMLFFNASFACPIHSFERLRKRPHNETVLVNLNDQFFFPAAAQPRTPQLA
jgi:hypothetical protein